jgi:uncharacterized protein (TIGR03437 family)
MLRTSLLAGLLLILIGVSESLFKQPPRRVDSPSLLNPMSVGNLRRTTNTSEDIINLNPSLSGDGRIMAFETTGDLAHVGGVQGFRAIRADLSASLSPFIQFGASRAVTPAISQDGSRIAFASNEDLIGANADRNSEIFLVDGATVRQLTNTTAADVSNRVRDGNFQPSITDDGTIVAFSSNRDLNGLNPELNLEVFTVEVTSGLFTQVTSSAEAVGASSVKISGDGLHIAFIHDRSQGDGSLRDLLLHDRSSRQTITVATDRPGLVLSYGRAISDDGRRVVFSAEAAPFQSQVFLFDAVSNTTFQVSSLGARTDDIPLHPTISGDGKRIVFATRRNVIGGNNDRSAELYLYDLPSQQMSKLTDAPSAATAEVVSSLNDDGSRAAFNFARVLSGPVSTNDLANNSEIYVTAIEPRPSFGHLTVLNGASHDNETEPDSAIAPDSIAIAKGVALAFESKQSERAVDGSFPLSLGGTVVTVNGRAARILFVSPTQVTLVVPPETELGQAEVLITNREGFHSRTTVVVMASAPGLFSVTGDGRGTGIILDADTLQTGPFDPTSGELRLILFATGSRLSSDQRVSLAGRSLPVESLQLSTTLPGLDELHVLIPQDLRGAGIVTLSILADGRESNRVELTLSGSFIRDLLINEFLADPAEGLAGDANRDGVRDSSHDEFVELVNTTERDLDLSGYQLLTRGPTASNDVVRHRFAESSVLSAGSALVIFGGGTFSPINPVFGGSQVYKASTGGLSLLNSAAVITLKDASGNIVTSLNYGGLTGIKGDANESATRFPDITGSFQLHQTATGSNGRLFSPGTRVDGTAFVSLPAVFAIVVSPPFKTVTAGDQILFTAKGFDHENREMTGLIFGWRSDNDAVAQIDQTGVARALAAGTAQITAMARGVQSTPATLVVSSPSPTPTSSPTPSPTPSPSPGTTPRVVISEFRTRGPEGASDEFVELYNNSDEPVDISGWKIKGSSSTGAITTRLTISPAVVISPRGHFLAANLGGYSEAVPYDVGYSSGFSNDGGIALTTGNDEILDQVGLSQGSAFREGMHLAPLPSDANQSYERKPGGLAGSTQDTGDNFTDFQLITPSDPQNLSGSNPLPSPSPTPSPSATPTPTPTPLPTPTPSPTPLPTIVISEFRTRGPQGASDEFIELYNYGDTAIPVAGWKIKGSGSTGTISTRLTMSGGLVVPSHGHLLITNSGGYSGSVPGDQTYTNGIANDGGIAVTLPTDEVIDQVGMSSGSAFREGMHLAPLPSNANQSYERRPGGSSGSSVDTSDNFSDFQLVTPSDPQNLNSNPTPGQSPTPSPSPSIAPSPSPSISPTPTPSPSPTPSPAATPTPMVVISEFRTRGQNGATDEFVEIYNNSDLPISVGGWKIRGSSSSGSITTRLTITGGTTLPARGHFLAANSSYSGSVVGDQTYTSGIANDGGIALTLPDDSVVDQVALSAGSAFREGMHLAPLPSDANQSYERKPGGFSGSTRDTNDNFTDFQLLSPSDPQNLSSNPTPGPSPTPQPTPSQSPTPSPTVTQRAAKPFCRCRKTFEANPINIQDLLHRMRRVDPVATDPG